MIKEVWVKNIGGIQSAHLQFHGRFISLTGESGSGKSSFVRALECLVGKRGSASVIKGGEETGEVEASLAASMLPSLDLVDSYFSEKQSFVVKRTVSRKGKGRCTINGHVVSLNTLKKLLAPRVGIQSQFSQIDLIDPKKQLELIDAYCGESARLLKDELRQTISRVSLLKKELGMLTLRKNEIERKYQNAEAILSYVQRLSLTPGIEEAWEEELLRLEAEKKNAEKLDALRLSLTGDSSGGGLIDTLEGICRSLPSVSALVDMDETGSWIKLGESALDALRSLSGKIESVLERNSISLLEEKRERLETRLGLLRKMKRAASVHTVAELLDYAESASQEIEWMRESSKREEELRSMLSIHQKEAVQRALALRDLRKKACLDIEAKINQHLQDLDMQGFCFRAALVPLRKIGESGADLVQFDISLLEGTPFPLAKIASGGELSRILLALELAAQDHLSQQVLIFDEVEAGLGGKAALLAGYKLRELSSKCQVILITHEATIASLSDQQFVVKKLPEKNETAIYEVQGDARELELARMLSGTETIPEAREHAKALLEAASRLRDFPANS